MTDHGGRPPEGREPVLRPMTHPQREYHALLARALTAYIERGLPLQATWASGRWHDVETRTYTFVVVQQAFHDVRLELRPYDP